MIYYYLQTKKLKEGYAMDNMFVTNGSLYLSGEVSNQVDLAHLTDHQGESIIHLFSALLNGGIPSAFDTKGGVVLLHIIDDEACLKSTENPHDRLVYYPNMDEIGLSAIHVCPVCNYKSRLDSFSSASEGFKCKRCIAGTSSDTIELNGEGVNTLVNDQNWITPEPPYTFGSANETAVTYEGLTHNDDSATVLEQDVSSVNTENESVKGDNVLAEDLEKGGDDVVDSFRDTKDIVVETSVKDKVTSVPVMTSGNLLDANLYDSARLLDQLRMFGVPIDFRVNEGQIHLMVEPVTKEPMLCSTTNPYQWIVFDEESEIHLLTKCRCSMCGKEGTVNSLNWSFTYDLCGKCDSHTPII